jgi:DNA-binding NtrC family response regulator
MAENAEIKNPIANILIIDDEVRLREAMQKILTRSGYYVDIAGSLNAAKNLMENRVYDLLLVDIVLPTTTGLEIIAELQQNFKPFPKFIFITGEPNYQTCLQALRLGAIDYLEKPVNKDLLNTHITHALQVKSEKTNSLEKKPKIKKEVEKVLDLSSEFISSIQESADSIHNALVSLKKSSGDNFSEEERELLNTIAKNVASIRKKFKEFD